MVGIGRTVTPGACMSTSRNEIPACGRAAVLYLVMNHVAAGVLVAALLLLGSAHATTDMARIAGVASAALPAAGLVFSLALVGFLTKAGVMPFHVWLPRAHPAVASFILCGDSSPWNRRSISCAILMASPKP